jgi:threonine aldolase
VKVIDLRSDTVTHPTPAMREAMATAEVGDDVFGDDPTVNRLEAMAARMLGKEAAVFVASGTMGNLVALLSHCKRGDEAIVGSETHMLYYEVGAAAGLAGVQLRSVPNDSQGRLDPKDVGAMIRGQDIHFPRTSLVCLENTHNRCGGAALTAADTAAVAGVAHDHGAALHVDGARIFNAAVALAVPAASLAEGADSISFCLSKGLSAPVGSLVCGRSEFVERARKSRKMLGGGMRQVGVLAAPGIVALENMVERLQEDHDNARLLAQGLADIRGIKIDPETVQTNIVVFNVPEQKVVPLFAALAKAGVLALPYGPGKIRMVTHCGVSRQDIEETLERVRNVCSASA